MSDLISRSELIENLMKCEQLGRKSFWIIVNAINEQPTAYDIDEVVSELKTDSSVKLYGSQNSDNYMIPVKRAIEIVKQGVVRKDVDE